MMFLLVLSGCSVLRSKQTKQSGREGKCGDDVDAAGPLMKFAYDTMRGVSALNVA